MNGNARLFNHGYGLFIGVGNYLYAGALPVTVNDATVLYTLFTHPDRAGYPVDHVRLLTNEQASRQGIMDGLDWLIACTESQPSATVVIYYSGHGGTRDEGYMLLAYDFRQPAWRDTSIGQEEFVAKIARLKSRKLLVFLDCCHAAGMTAKQAGHHRFMPSNQGLYQALAGGRGRVVVASCKANQKSYILPGASYSAFTNALIDALDYLGDNGNGYATVLQTLAIVNKVTTAQSAYPQTPVYDFYGVEDFPICRTNVKLAEQLPFKKTDYYLDRQTASLPSLLRYKVPLKPVFFLGRELLLKEIHRKLTDNSMRQPVLLLSGIGGMGKTTLMQEYLRSQDCQGTFDRIIFASVRQSIQHAFASAVIGACKLESLAPDPDKNETQSFQFAVQELEKLSGSNLFVIDNVNEKNYEELDALRSILMNIGWKFLITTRTVPDRFAHIPVEELDMQDAKLLFAYHFAEKEIDIAFPEDRVGRLGNFLKERAIAHDLEVLLAHILKHTLLTELLAKAAATKGISLHRLLTILKEQDYKHPDLQRTIQPGPHADSTHRERLSNSTLHNYLLSLFETEYLEKPTGDESKDRENQAKTTMLRFFSVLPSTDMPISDLKALWRVGTNEENPFEDRLEELRKIGWLQGKQDPVAAAELIQNLFFKMHPLVQEVVYDKLKPDTKNCRPLIQTITQALNNPGKYSYIYQTYAKGIAENFDNLKKKIHGTGI